MGLADTGKKKARDFSLGMKQRLGIAVALAGDPAACEAMRKQQAEQINANSAQDIARFVLCENANDD